MSHMFGRTGRERGSEAQERWGGFVSAGAGGGGAGPVRFAWIDEESGERLLVDVEGSEDFFLELEALGFERQGPAREGETAPEDPVPGWIADLAAARAARRGA